jgi:putative peptidoglycan lipid II flippase
VVRLLFQRGEFGAAEAVFTAQALVGYAVGLPAFSATRIAAQTFYALGDIRTPVYAGFVSVAANVLLALVLMWPLQHVGLALASSLSSYVNLAVLGFILRRRGLLGGDGLGLSLARTLGASSVLLVSCLWLGRALDSARHGSAATVSVLGAGFVLYVATAAVLRAPELGALAGIVSRRGHALRFRRRR